MIVFYGFITLLAMLGAVVLIVIASDAIDRWRQRRHPSHRPDARVVDISTARLQHKLREDLRDRRGR